MLLYEIFDIYFDLVEMIVVKVYFAYIQPTIYLVCKNINILSYSTTINAIEFDLSVFAIIPILFTRHIVSHSFINFIFCCFENVSVKIV